MSESLQGKGKQILANGYNLIPILPGAKLPSIKGWQKTETSSTTLNGWLANGKAKHGCGIPTKFTPFADLDIQNPECLTHVREHIETAWDWPPCRIGNPPKCGYVFKLTGKPFAKISSPIFTDPQGRKAQVEILADGQQFVAYAIHPDTHKPYVWIRDKGPVNIPVDELPEATEAELRRIADVFTAYCEAQGWRRKGSALAVLPDDRPDFYDEDDDTIAPYSDAPIGLSEDELREKVAAIPNEDAPYEGPGLTWLNMVAAIHHETDGSEAGREIALEWAEKSSKHEGEAGKFEKTWESFNKGAQRPVTARLILKLWKAIETERKAREIDELIGRMRDATTIDQLLQTGADCRKVQTDLIDRSRLIGAMQKFTKELTGTTLGVREARELVRYRPTAETAKWLDGWCYLTHAKLFFNVNTGQRIEREAFDASFGRHVGQDGVPSKLALDVIKIPVYHMTIYLPGQETVFTDTREKEWINTYSAKTVPAMPAIIGRPEMRAIELVEEHTYMICGNDRDAGMLHSVLAYPVQTRQRVNWATLIQGAEGIGKTLYANVAAAILGPDNVYIVNADTLQSNFTAWAEARQLIFIEELRSHGHSRFEIYDRLKPFITNDMIEIHPKRVNPYNVPNTATYIAATNHSDALPLGISDTRYYVILSRLQLKQEVDEFKRRNPAYFNELYAAIRDYPGALRHWMMHYPLHRDFDPDARAPNSDGKRRMIEEGKTDEQAAIEDVVADARSPLVSDDFIVVHLMREMLMEEDGHEPEAFANAVGIKRALGGLGYKALPRIRINGTMHRCWTKIPKLINGTLSDIRNHVEVLVKGDI